MLISTRIVIISDNFPIWKKGRTDGIINSQSRWKIWFELQLLFYNCEIIFRRGYNVKYAFIYFIDGKLSQAQLSAVN